jgi:6-pyruvoyltetrahydropterin/6-carboxytetrahydropterin synthase
VGHKCRNLHGHSYVIEVFCEGPLDQRGFVVDYSDISTAVDPIIKKLDHQNLNEIIPFATTAENLGAYLWPYIFNALPSLVRIDVHETAKTCVRVEK